MSEARVNSIIDAAGGNTVTVNGVQIALASQAEAQGGTDNAKLMTPLRVKEAAVTAASAQAFTAPGTWTKPANTKFVKVTVVGGGGGGGSSVAGQTTPSTGRVGGGGGVAVKYIPAASITGPVTVTRGAGGAAGAAGGTSSFGAFVSASGGGAGGNGNAGAVGTSGVATGADLSDRQTGLSYGLSGSVVAEGGSGGSSPGSTPSPSSTVSGTAGGNGIVIVEVFE